MEVWGRPIGQASSRGSPRKLRSRSGAGGAVCAPMCTNLFPCPSIAPFAGVALSRDGASEKVLDDFGEPFDGFPCSFFHA